VLLTGAGNEGAPLLPPAPKAAAPAKDAKPAKK
jgi:hypothetical protein